MVIRITYKCICSRHNVSQSLNQYLLAAFCARHQAVYAKAWDLCCLLPTFGGLAAWGAAVMDLETPLEYVLLESCKLSASSSSSAQ